MGVHRKVDGARQASSLAPFFLPFTKPLIRMESFVQNEPSLFKWPVPFKKLATKLTKA
jgi:hypothetical protein